MFAARPFPKGIQFKFIFDFPGQRVGTGTIWKSLSRQWIWYPFCLCCSLKKILAWGVVETFLKTTHWHKIIEQYINCSLSVSSLIPLTISSIALIANESTTTLLFLLLLNYSTLEKAHWGSIFDIKFDYVMSTVGMQTDLNCSTRWKNNRWCKIVKLEIKMITLTNSSQQCHWQLILLSCLIMKDKIKFEFGCYLQRT